MFAKNLTLDQKKILITMAYRIMVADYQVRIEESELLSALENELGVADEISDDELRSDPDLSVLDSREARVGVMLKLFAIAHADSVIHQAETRKLREYGRRMGFDEAALDRMDRWGRMHLELVREALEIAADRGAVVTLDVRTRVAEI